jgi:hypothetical protein
MRCRFITLCQSCRVVGARVAVVMNCASNTATVTTLPPCSPAPLSATNRWSAAVALGLLRRKVRESPRVSRVTASGSEVVWRRHTPGERSVSVPVRGFVIVHDDLESHPNRARTEAGQATRAWRCASGDGPSRRASHQIAPRTMPQQHGNGLRKGALNRAFTRERTTGIEPAYSAWVALRG